MKSFTFIKAISRSFAGWLPLNFWLMAGALTITPQEIPAQTASREYHVKAAFLFNFAQFVEWPTNAFAERQTPMIIGIVGDDPFGAVLDEIVRGESVNGHPLMVQRYRQIEEIKTCHILFITESAGRRLEEILVKLKGQSILTVGDAGEFNRRGGMIRFATEQNKIRLRINPDAAKAANLTISSKLLKAAEIVASAQN